MISQCCIRRERIIDGELENIRLSLLTVVGPSSSKPCDIRIVEHLHFLFTELFLQIHDQTTCMDPFAVSVQLVNSYTAWYVTGLEEDLSLH